jgi:hypothetical protein
MGAGKEWRRGVMDAGQIWQSGSEGAMPLLCLTLSLSNMITLSTLAASSWPTAEVCSTSSLRVSGNEVAGEVRLEAVAAAPPQPKISRNCTLHPVATALMRRHLCTPARLHDMTS